MSGFIDVHHHFIPRSWFEEPIVAERIKAGGGGRVAPTWYGWSPDTALREMDRTGVRAAVVSVTTPGIWFDNVEQGRRLSRLFNDYAAGVRAQHPDRFGVFAALPLPDTEGSLAEIGRAMDQLDVDGIGLMTSYGDKWLGDPDFAPVLEELNRRHAVVYVHPVAPPSCLHLMPYVPPFLCEYPQDTTRAILSLIFSGVLQRFPDIRFIFSHGGGTVSVLVGRINHITTQMQPDRFSKFVPNGFAHELKRFYFDITSAAYPSSMRALRETIPTSQILFGSDYPLLPIDETAEGLQKLGLAPEELQAISHGNALKLFPRLAA